MTIVISSAEQTAICPNCQMESERANGHYRRRPADLPCGGYQVCLDWRVRRFFCDNELCPLRTFSPRFSTIVNQYARRTNRLARQQQMVAFEVGGKAGARLSHITQTPASRDTHLRLVRQSPEPEMETPRVLGVDDWAKRKGHDYGTILVDLEKRQPVDLLPDRSADSLAEWLAKHPGVKVITRDRSGEYAEGATRGAPEAIQVADRFHLLQNLTDVLQRMFAKKPKELREAARQAAEQTSLDNQPDVDLISPTDNSPPPPAETVTTLPNSENDPPGETTCPEQPQTAAQLCFAEVKALQKKGLSKRAISNRLGIGRKTVRRYWALEEYPEKQHGQQSVSTVLPYHSYVIDHWQTTCENRQQLFELVQAQGYTGSYVSVWRYVDRLIKQGRLTAGTTQSVVVKEKSLAIRPLSARKAAWYLAARTDDLKPEEVTLRDLLCQISEATTAAYNLAQDFGQMIRERQVEKLDEWLQRAEASLIDEFHHFAIGLRRDYQAVSAALTYHWSQGQVEGQVNRLKFIKRQGYGRANFDLLRRRVLGPPAPT